MCKLFGASIADIFFIQNKIGFSSRVFWKIKYAHIVMIVSNVGLYIKKIVQKEDYWFVLNQI